MTHDPLKFGLFFQVPASAPQTAAGRYRDTLDQVRHADRLGFDTVWLAEGHFRPVFSVVPGPLILAATLAGLTERIRLGTAAIQLPLHHPIRIAEEAAMVDLLSDGRLDLGVGRGSSAPNAAAFGLDWATRDGRFVEQLDIIEQAWSSGAVTYRGQHYQYEDLPIVPRPQQPAPALHITANHPDMATFTGARGLGLLIGAAIHPPPDDYVAHLARYRDSFIPTPTGQPRPRARAVFWVFPGRDLADVRARIGPSLANNHIGARYSFETIAATFGIFGSPAECIDRIATLQALSPIDELICHFNPGGLVPNEQVLDAMTLLVEAVRPAFAGQRNRA